MDRRGAGIKAVILDSQRMRDLGITMQKMRDAIRASNADVGGRTVELSECEYVIRGKGYIKSINDLGNVVLKTSNGTPVLLRDIARVERLFSPLAFTKTFSMAAAALLSVTLVPALMVIFVRGRIAPEHRNPLNRFLIWIYRR